MATSCKNSSQANKMAYKGYAIFERSINEVGKVQKRNKITSHQSMKDQK